MRLYRPLWDITRHYSSRSPPIPDAAHTLTAQSPFVRTLDNKPFAFPVITKSLEQHFSLYPGYFSVSECAELLKAALWKLDKSDTSLRRRRGKNAINDVDGGRDGLQKLFQGEYGFEDGHFDSVIHKYRETLLSNLPPPSNNHPNLSTLLNRAYTHLPLSPNINTGSGTTPPESLNHLLHLSPDGRIDAHVDNLDASGSVIIGVCLGASRILRLEKDGQGWDILLENGSLYVQQGSVRYEYKHSILGYDHPDSKWNGKGLEAGHRISIMIRDAPTKSAQL